MELLQGWPALVSKMFCIKYEWNSKQETYLEKSPILYFFIHAVSLIFSIYCNNSKNTEIYDETREFVADTGHEQCKDWYPQNNNEKSWGYGRINILFEAEREAGCG